MISYCKLTFPILLCASLVNCANTGDSTQYSASPTAPMPSGGPSGTPMVAASALELLVNPDAPKADLAPKQKPIGDIDGN